MSSKKKQYFTFKITWQDKYIDVLRVQDSETQSLIKFEVDSEVEVISCSELAHKTLNWQFTVKKNDQNTELSRIAADFINNVIMTDKLRWCLMISKKKKLFKKLKIKFSEIFERILTLLMNQEVCNVIMKNLLKFLLTMHKMMFQNLSAEMIEEKLEMKENEIIIISRKVMNELSSLNNFWAVELLKYFIKIENNKILTMFDSKVEVNIMLYLIILKLKLAACLKVAVHMKKVENHKSFFINYISDVLICIENVRILQISAF